MAGILSAIKLTEAGYTDFTVYEKGDSVGGTWRENTYPGLACDVPSQLYSYSFAPNPNWTQPYSRGSEIQAYFTGVAQERGVIERTRFNDEVKSCEFADGKWHLVTANGHEDVVDVVIAATGVLHHPSMPDIAGLESFGGKSFHSARWDHDAVLDGARVGLIGTGSTGVQIVSAIHDRVERLDVFQRTAQWVLQMPNEPFTSEELEGHQDLDVLRDNHEKLSVAFRRFSNAVIDAESEETAVIGAACLFNLEQNVADPELRERLRPTYTAACKRLIISPDFYEAMQHENVVLVTDHIAEIVPQGVRTDDGVVHELDVLVLATGFHADYFVRPMKVIGRDGVTIDEAWKDRPLAYLSIAMPDFPNFFMLNGPNGPVGNFSLIEVAEMQFAYIEQLLAELSNGTAEISPNREVTLACEAERAAAAAKTVWMTGCNSWYLDDRGIPATWPWPFDRFRDAMAKPNWEAFDLVSATQRGPR